MFGRLSVASYILGSVEFYEIYSELNNSIFEIPGGLICYVSCFWVKLGHLLIEGVID